MLDYDACNVFFFIATGDRAIRAKRGRKGFSKLADATCRELALEDKNNEIPLRGAFQSAV